MKKSILYAACAGLLCTVGVAGSILTSELSNQKLEATSSHSITLDKNSQWGSRALGSTSTDPSITQVFSVNSSGSYLSILTNYIDVGSGVNTSTYGGTQFYKSIFTASTSSQTVGIYGLMSGIKGITSATISTGYTSGCSYYHICFYKVSGGSRTYVSFTCNGSVESDGIVDFALGTYTFSDFSDVPNQFCVEVASNAGSASGFYVSSIGLTWSC